MRGFSKAGARKDWEIYIYGDYLIIEDECGGARHWSDGNPASAEREFAKEIATQERQGWKESERSLSRRIFQHTHTEPGKYWIVWLDDNNIFARFGKVLKGPAHWNHQRGQLKVREYSSHEEALKEYEKAIAAKLVEGYQEVYARQTPYSDLGRQLAEGKKAKPKVVRTPKPAPAQENLATVLGGSQREIHREVSSRIELDPADLFGVFGKPWMPLPRPAPQPLDVDACSVRAAKIKDMDQRREPGSWLERLQVPKVMTQEEAFFWVRLLTSVNYHVPPAKAVETMAKTKWQGALPIGDAKAMMKDCYWQSRPDVIHCLSFLLAPADVMEVLLEAGDEHSYIWLAQVFRDEVLLYRGEEEIASLRGILAAQVDPHVKTRHGVSYYSGPTQFAAVLGCHKEIGGIVSGWQSPGSGNQSTRHYQPREFLFALEPDTMVAQFRRLQMKWDRPAHLRAWLARTGLRALDVVAETVLAATNKAVCEQMLAVFALAKAPEAAEHMLRLSLSAKAPALARHWLETEVGNAIAGLVPVAAGSGKLAEAALEYLRNKKREGFGDLIGAVVAGGPPQVSASIDALLKQEEKAWPVLDNVPSWLADAVQEAAALRPLRGTTFVQIGRLPAIVVNGNALGQEHVAAVLLALQHAEPNAPGVLIDALKRHARPDSLADFAWQLYEQWLGEGAPAKQKWAMLALGYFGIDATVFRLTPLIRAWPGESQHSRALLGLDCLRTIGTDNALMALNGIAQKVKFKGLKEAAARCMEQIAEQKGLTRPELEDRIVPDCELDERGSRVFDFGARRFRFVLGRNLKPMIKDEGGAVKADLPKPGAKDDADKAREAIEQWRLLKKQVAAVAKVQSFRLEQAMITGRRWSADGFETLLVRHPLMVNLVRLVVCGVYDKAGNVTATFRVTDDQKLADRHDRDFKLGPADIVGIVHPLHLGEADLSHWGEILSDYELLPPFPQLGRPVKRLRPEEEGVSEITRFAGIRIPGQALVIGLEQLGWTRGPAMDNGIFDELVKYFPGADVTVVLKFEGLTMGWVEGWKDQAIEHCFFVRGQEKATCFRDFRMVNGVLGLGDVDPVVLSEVLMDLDGIAAKGK